MGDVGVLELVHHQVVVTPLVFFLDVGVLLQQLHSPHQQIVKIDRVAATQQFLVIVVDPGGHLFGELVLKLSLLGQAYRVHQDALGSGYDALHGPGVVKLFIDVGHLHCLFYQAELVVGVVNGVVRVQAHSFTEAAQHAGAEGMEGAGKDGVGIGHLQGRNAVPHFPRCLVGEGDGGYPVGADVAFSRQVGDAVGNHACLAASRAGHYEQRTLSAQHRFGLGVVQAGKEINSMGGHNQEIIS